MAGDTQQGRIVGEWEEIPHTGERILRNTRTGRIIEFTDDIHAPHEELPMLGLVDFFAPEDLEELRKKYTDYELLSGGA